MVTKLCLLLCLGTLGSVVRAVPPLDTTPLNFAEQDQTGTVWAINAYFTNGTIYCWKDGAWQAQTVPETSGYMPRSLGRGDDGSVYALWQAPQEGHTNVKPQDEPPVQCLITVHSGDTSRVLAHFTNPFGMDQGMVFARTLWAGSQGDVWIAGQARTLWHVSPAGQVKAFPLPIDWYFPSRQPPEYRNQPTLSLTDGQGRRWFWQDNLDGSSSADCLRGVLIWDGASLAYHARLSGVPDRPFSVFAPKDANHFWLAVPGSGLYVVDTRTLTGELVAPPARGAFQNVQQIFQANGEWYVVESSGLFWRQRRGHWRWGGQNLDQSGYPSSDIMADFPLRPWLATPQGTWLGANGGGAWWLPAGDGPPVSVDWRRDLALSAVHGLFRLADGAVMVFQPAQGTAVLPPQPLPLRPLPVGFLPGDAMKLPQGVSKLVADPRRHFWGVPDQSRRPSVLYEWDGDQWREHALFRSSNAVNDIITLLACDSLGRLWMRVFFYDQSARTLDKLAVYDPIHDTTTLYDSLQDALKAAASMPGLTLLPNRHNFYLPIILSGEGRAVYTEQDVLYFYDGIIWRQWDRRKIDPSNDYARLTANPDFSRAGLLEIYLDYTIWEWTPQDGWRRTNQRPFPWPDTTLPPGGPVGKSETAITDNRGARWLTWQGGLYEEWHGLWAKQPLSWPTGPFGDGRRLDDVLLDSKGRFFFFSWYFGNIVWQPAAPPAPRIVVTPRAADAVTLRFVAALTEPHWFLWRTNGGPWSEPQRGDTVTLTALPRGEYEVEALTLDSQLQAAAQPSQAAFTIHIDPQAQIAGCIQTLKTGDDDAREAAIAALLKQPALALPALQAARQGASEDALWWITAALAQINLAQIKAPSD